MLISLAVFGSHARGDSDTCSDRDLLIVGDTGSVLAVAEEQMLLAGCACSACTTAKLRWMAVRGSLFIQHLRHESWILSDANGRLRDVLPDYRPKSNYVSKVAGG